MYSTDRRVTGTVFSLPVTRTRRYHCAMIHLLHCTTHRSIRFFVALLTLATLLLNPATSDAKTTKPDGTQVVSRAELSKQLVAETGLPVDLVVNALKPARFQPEIIKSMNGQWEAKPYRTYRPLFVKTKMQQLGRDYISANHDLFTQIAEKYQVDAEIIAAILGIETRFGANHGGHPVLDSLYTLSTGFPRRAKFFRSQLGAIIEISRQDKLDLKSLKGSYAGAFGAIQFIPTSFRRFAVDEDGDGIRDVFHSNADILASIANYFKQHQWQFHRPSAYWLAPGSKLNNRWKKRAAGKLDHWTTLGALRKSMPKIFNRVPLPWRDDDKVSIITMETRHGKQLALVHYNFYVIMRYNPSFNYAMAVTEIASMLERKTFAVD